MNVKHDCVIVLKCLKGGLEWLTLPDRILVFKQGYNL
jgi:hypothetical protein